MTERDARELMPLALEVLLALAQGTVHGYALIERVSAQSDGLVVLGSSTFCATLHSLARDWRTRGVRPSAPAGPRRRVFRITGLGRRVASQEVARLRPTVAVGSQRLAGRSSGGRS